MHLLKEIWRNLFNRDNFFILLFVLLVGLGIANIPVDLDILNPIEQTTSDFDITDIYFSKIKSTEKNHEDRITIVNIGDLSREAIAEQLQIINRYRPRVIGIDSFFRKLRKDKEAEDSLFAASLALNPNTVLVTQASYKHNSPELDKEKPSFDTLELSHPLFEQYAQGGFANLITSATRQNILTSDLAGGLATCRTFSPKETINKEVQLAFGVKIAQIYDPEKTRLFLERNNEVEHINFVGNYQSFNILDIEDLFMMEEEGSTEALQNLIEGKIVLLGYMGSTINTHSVFDKFYTPLNPNYIGRAEYDMFGIVVHANIIRMILEQDYIDEAEDWLDILASLLIGYISIAFFAFVYRRFGFWYDGISLVTQLLISVFLLYVIILIFDTYRIRVDWGIGFLAVVLAPNLLEIYYGVVKRLYERAQERLLHLNDKEVPVETEPEQMQ